MRSIEENNINSADEHGSGNAGQQGLIQRRMRCRKETEEMSYHRDSEMGWKNGVRLGNYQQGTTTNLRAYCPSNKLGKRATADLHSNLECIWRL